MNEALMVRGVRFDRKTRGRIRMLFPFEPIGTALYLKKYSEEELVLTKNPLNDGMEKIFVRSRSKSKGKSNYPTLDLTNYIKENGFLTTLFNHENEEYTIRPSSVKEVLTIGKKELIRCKNRDSLEGHFSQNGDYILGRKLMREWMGPNHFVLSTVHLENSKSYIEFTPILENGVYPFMAEAETFRETYSYVLSNHSMLSGKLSFPKAFINRVGLERVKNGKVWKTEQNSLILEPAPLKCAICGNKISNLHEHENICVKAENLKNLSVIGKLMSEASKMTDPENRFNMVNKDLHDLKMILDELN